MNIILSQTDSIVNHFIAELRAADIQKDRAKFRRNMEKIGEVFAYEISKNLNYHQKEVHTPLGIAKINLLSEQPVIATILRAGLPLHQGLINFFDDADCAFIGAFRKHTQEDDFDIQMDYVSTPDLNHRTLILADPMLATGKSIVLCCKELLKRYNISQIHIVAIIASKIGLEYVHKELPSAHLWIGALDNELSSKSYIIPGLGDAGDLAYGEKL